MLVVLDPGHYGKYNRSPIVKSFYESEFNWKMTYYMKQYFEEMGIKVKLTKYSSSIDLPVYNRGLLAKGADIFLSIHSNACDDPNVDYPVVIRGFDEKSTDKLALSLAELISETMDTWQEGRTYVRKKTTRNDEWYGVLRGARAVGVKYRYIIEHSFYTNKKSALWLSNENNIKKLAKLECELIAQYFGYKKFAETISPKRLHLVRVKVDDLNVRRVADWKAKPCQVVNKGDVFTIVDTVEAKNGRVKMYKLKSGLYITTASQYVEDFYQE